MSQKLELNPRRKNNEFSVPPIKSKAFNKARANGENVQTQSFKKSKEEYIQRVRSIYSPNIAEKSNKNYQMHSRVTMLKGKLPATEVFEEFSNKLPDFPLKPDAKLKKPIEITYDNQKFIIQSNKFDHLTVKLAEKTGQFAIREDILKLFPVSINSSNSVSVVPSQSSNYSYYLGKGNNSDLVKRILSTRPWWTQAEEDNFPNVNFVWTQSVNSKYIQTIPLSDHSKQVTEGQEKTKLESLGLGYEMITCSDSFVMFNSKTVWASSSIRVHNRLEHNFNLSDKKFLYLNMRKYYKAIGENVFDYLPITFHVQHGEDDDSFYEFVKTFENFKSKKMLNLWILKPGENCNRGNGICVCNSVEQVRNELRSNPFPRTGEHTYVIQKYIEKPFLVNRRKFDIRIYCLVTSVNGFIQAYYYHEGYIRTSCKEYNPKILDNKFIHLTNDAVQKKSEDYGRFEFANKMSYSEFQRYLDNHRPKVFVNMYKDILPAIKKMIQETILATYRKLDLRRRSHTFEVLGYDFLIDEHLKPWLIEVNTNPCLELSSGLLATIIPSMLENAFRIALDPLFPPPLTGKNSSSPFYFSDNSLENKFELIFHEHVDGPKLVEKLEQRRTLQDFLSDYI